MNILNDFLNSLILEHNEVISCLNINEFKENLYHLKNSNTTIELSDTYKPKIYNKYLIKTIELLQDNNIDIERLSNVFDSIYYNMSLNNKGIVVDEQPYHGVEKIFPDYLSEIPKEFDKITKEILKGDVDKFNIDNYYMSGLYADKMKKKLVKLKQRSCSVLELDKVVTDRPIIVPISNDYVRNKIKVFIKNYNDEMKSICNIADKTSALIMDNWKAMKYIKNTITNMKSEDIPDDIYYTMNYFRFVMIRIYMSMCAYVTTAIMKKMIYLKYNLLSYFNLSKSIFNYFQNDDLSINEFVCESVSHLINEKDIIKKAIIDGDTRTISDYIGTFCNKNIAFIDNSTIYTKDSIKYDSEPYSFCNSIIDMISKRLRKFESLAETDMIVNDIIDTCKLDKIKEIYSDAIEQRIYSLKFYNQDQPVNGTVSLDIRNEFTKINEIVSSLILDAHNSYKYMNSLMNKFESEKEETEDYARYTDLCDFICEFKGDYLKYLSKLFVALFKRLLLLEEYIIEITPEKKDPIKIEEGCDYSIDVAEEALSCIKESEKIEFEALFMEFNKVKYRKQTGGVLVYEAIETTPANGNGSTTPSAQTNTQEQHDEKNNNSSNKPVESSDNNSTGNQNNENKETLIQKFTNFIKSLLEKFKANSKKIIEKDDVWLKNIKNHLLSLDTSKTYISVASYKSAIDSTINSDILSASNKIKSVNPKKLPNELKGEISVTETYLFPSIPKWAKADFKTRVKTLYTYGNSGIASITMYSGNDAKTKIQEMITYCENYQKTYTSVSDNLSKLADVVSAKESDISAVKNTNAQSIKTQPSDYKNAMSSVVRDYTGAILTVLEKKYLDYMKVFNDLVPNRKKNQKHDEASIANTDDSENNKNNK